MSDELEELARRAGEVEPAWDDLREQRVLESIRRAPRPETPRRPIGPWLAAGAAALVLVGATWSWATDEPARTAEPPGVSAPVAPDESELVLADGSTVTLGPDARVRVLAQEPEQAVLEQERGRAVFAVTHAPERSFEVWSPAAIIRVRGTVFVVEVTADATLVEVREGRVEVEARTGDGRRSLLGAGDTLSVAAVVGPEPAPEAQRPGPGEAPSEAPRSEAAHTEAPPRDAPPSDAPPSEARPAAAAAEPARRPEPPPSADALLARADEARLAADPASAARALQAFLEHHASDGRAASAAFTLGRVENRRGRPSAAAQAFARSRRLEPGGPLAEDALAQEALAWSAAGDPERARAAARRYEAAHPEGLHRARLRRLLSEE